MVYMAADNDLEQFGIKDFLEMSSVGSNSDVNIVVQFDRTPEFDSTYDNCTDTRQGLIQAGDLPNSGWGTSIGEANMGDPIDTPLAKAEGILDSQNRLADAELLQHQ